MNLESKISIVGRVVVTIPRSEFDDGLVVQDLLPNSFISESDNLIILKAYTG